MQITFFLFASYVTLTFIYNYALFYISGNFVISDHLTRLHRDEGMVDALTLCLFSFYSVED